ncbi:MAG: DUF222 domain-containing protein, partial [Actinotalea sp.]|nr:DUF222 domain-containing protein [Actinotalea sp.]
TTPQLSAAARRAVLALDPDAAEKRHRRAREDRCVVLEPSADCMAVIRAYLPADDAARTMRALDAVAAAAAPDDPRGLDARRADALADVLGAVLDHGVTPHGLRLRQRKGRAPRLNLTISTDALAGATSAPGLLDGYGPVLPSIARRLADEASWHFQRTDPATGEALEQPGSRYRPPDALRSAIVARDVTCTFPGCRVSAQVCDLDHTVPFDDARGPADQTRRSNLAALCRHHHRLKTHGRWTPQRDPRSGVVVWSSPTGKPYTRDPVAAPGEAPPPGTAPPGHGEGPADHRVERPPDHHSDRPLDTGTDRLPRRGREQAPRTDGDDPPSPIDPTEDGPPAPPPF